MQPFSTFTAVAAYLDRSNVDTDLIIPKQFLKRIDRHGYGVHLFNDLRFTGDGKEDPSFVLNAPRYKGAGVLVSLDNFGGGSSREAAAWAIQDYGFKAVVAAGFADIFSGNSLKIGLLLVQLPLAETRELIRRIRENEGYAITVDLEKRTLTGSDGWTREFEIDPFKREKLLEGRDDIAAALALEPEIRRYEEAHGAPWEAALPERDPNGADGG
ncbi:MAG: 3-isopropylmalate dehydratase small subunit [Deltaproteobacteria bacterium]|jgi:3-isopropylmalate/(R)-2-methylmalate dehydratase small subunit|nr:3-isopropylmalate dehydratase small subunit [Deltaproteobacteria bacterium]